MTTQASTKIWKSGPNGPVLVKTFAGLPFGTEQKAFIPDLGQANRTGQQTSGSGEAQSIVAVEYTLL